MMHHQADHNPFVGISLARADDRRKVSAPALNAFFRIAALWNLTIKEQMILLGLTARSTYFNWKKSLQAPCLSRDTLERISYLLGIYKALQILLPDPSAADSWIKKPNHAPLFGGNSALERLLSGNVSDLYEVRQYLDSQRGE